MPAGSKRGLVAPQNTFLESIIRKTSQFENQCSFLIANSELWNWPIVYANEGFCYITGIPRSEIITQSCLCEFMHGHQTKEESVEKFREELSKKNRAQIELVLYTREGTPLWFLIQIALVKNDVEESVFFLLTFKDITEEQQPLQGHEKSAGGKFPFLTAFKQAKEISVEQKLTCDSPKPSSKNHRIPEILNLNPEMIPKYHHEAPKTPRHIILHYSDLKVLWDWLILMLTFYTATIVPYNVAFQVKNKNMGGFWLISDSMVDVVFLMDVVINFITTYVGPGGEVISDPKVIRMNYLKSWFVVDLLSCLPYDLFNYFFRYSKNGISEDGISSLFSSLKVVRLLRLGRIARKMDHYIEYGGAMLILLVCFFGLSGHWLACIWFTIGSNQLEINGTVVSTNWLVILGEQTNQPFSIEGDLIKGGPTATEAYICALYFTMTSLTSVGFGNVSANTVSEQIFCVIMLIFGALLYATIFGNVTTIIQQMYAETNRYHDMLNSVREFLKLYQIPDSLSDRIMDYIVSTWSMSKGIDTSKVLNYCPKDMKADICVHLNRKVFNNYSAFRLASDSCLRALAIEFISSHSAPGDMIYHKGESVDALNFVISGSVEIIQDDQVVAILSKGDAFGDAFWIDGEIGHSSCHVRALTYCNLNSIKRDALMRVLNFYESFAASFRKKMTLTFNLRKRYYFRKISDIEKERDEAEKRKNDPTWEGNFADDHPIRGLFRKYKKRFQDRKEALEKKKESNKKSLQGECEAPSTSARQTDNNDSNKSKQMTTGGGNNLETEYVIMDSTNTASIVTAVALQSQKIEDMEKNIKYLVKTVDDLAKIVAANANSNRNNNIAFEPSSKSAPSRRISFNKKQNRSCFWKNKPATPKSNSRNKTLSSAQHCDLIYVNEQNQASDANPNLNGLVLYDLETAEDET